jgi:nucleoside-diphosphate-sugar epimerase
MIRNILVTGGAGYIGSTLVRLLLSKKYNVIVFDNLLFGGESLLGVWSCSNFKFVKGDITNYQSVEKVFLDNNIDAVVHLAAIVGDPACAKHSVLATKVNYNASVKLYNIALKHKVRKFIFASTCSNYGKMPSPNCYVDEKSPLAPVSLYAELKVKTENYILNSKKNKNFSTAILRFATAYGLSPRMRFDLTVNEFTKELVLGRELVVFGEQFWRPYCHAKDLAKACMAVLNAERGKIDHNVFNVGNTQENYQKQMIIEHIRKDIPDIKVKYVKKDEDPRDYKVDFSKINKILGFKTKITVPEGIKEIRQALDKGVFSEPDSAIYRNS